MYKDLRERNIKIPVEMSSSLLLLHSYLLGNFLNIHSFEMRLVFY